MELMRDIPDKSVDLVLTDPPYGINADKGSAGFGVAKGRRYKGGWDAAIPPKEAFDHIFRIGKNVIIFGGNYFAHYLPPSKHWIVWDKKGDISFQNPFADCELIYTSFDRAVKKIVFRQQGFITDSKDKRVHPTQKPSELMRMLVERYSSPGDCILDPFMGSGSTGVACAITGRHFIGIEKDAGYFAIAKERIEATRIKID